MRKHLFPLICIIGGILLTTGCSNLLNNESEAGLFSSGKQDNEADSSGQVHADEDVGQSEKSNGQLADNTQTPDGTGEGHTVDAVEWKPTEIQAVNNMEGVTMKAKEGTASPTGLTVVFSNESESDCIYGEFYTLEKKKGDSWYQVPIEFEGNYGFNSIGYDLAPDSDSEWTVDWEWLYGSLDKGEYRIVKDILDFKGTGNYDVYYLSAEFII